MSKNENLVNRGGWLVRPTEIMAFSNEPTAKADDIAFYAREWYEANREPWWIRLITFNKNNRVVADEFMLAFVQQISIIKQAADKYIQSQLRANPGIPEISGKYGGYRYGGY